MNKVEDANPKNNQWITPLHRAAFLGHLGVFDLIINKISDIQPRDKLGRTPLHLASKSGHLKVCQTILNKVKNKNPTSNNGTDHAEHLLFVHENIAHVQYEY